MKSTLQVITSKSQAEDLSYTLLINLRIGNSIKLGAFTITALENSSYLVRLDGANDRQVMHRNAIAHQILWPNRKSINALVKSGALDAYLAPAQAEEPSALLLPVPVVSPVPSTIKQFTLDDLEVLSSSSWRLPNIHASVLIHFAGREYLATMESTGSALEATATMPVMLDVLSWMIAQPLEEQAPEAVPTGTYDQVPYDWQAWQEEQEQAWQAQFEELEEELAQAQEVIEELEEQLFDVAPAPAPREKFIALSYAQASGTVDQAPANFRLIPYQEEPSAIERLQIACDAFDAWQAQTFSIFAQPLVCACSYIGMLFLLLYTLANR